MLASDLTRGMTEDKGTNILLRQMQKGVQEETDAHRDALLAKELQLPPEPTRAQEVVIPEARLTEMQELEKRYGHQQPAPVAPLQDPEVAKHKALSKWKGKGKSEAHDGATGEGEGNAGPSRQFPVPEPPPPQHQQQCGGKGKGKTRSHDDGAAAGHGLPSIEECEPWQEELPFTVGMEDIHNTGAYSDGNDEDNPGGNVELAQPRQHQPTQHGPLSRNSSTTSISEHQVRGRSRARSRARSTGAFGRAKMLGRRKGEEEWHEWSE
ncbi:hypothetical protein DM02DRAFT_409435 [Periconia macrospinosa]|uniref:Uncharacterized protein n=1 Tax=Periconia macrospinosa TaxID=97972 RepID=A0A2V1EAZ3_9PLEO|nr:hypothetical protein DM02DRAFT_409435 [Periconia macrospinosa]